MNVRYALLLPLLLAPSVALAQLLEEQVEPELCVLSPPGLEVCFNNFTTDYPEPYPDPDTSVTGSLGVSLFVCYYPDCDAEEPIPLGVAYTPEGVVGEASYTYTADGSIRACEPVVSDLTGKIAFVERGDCFFDRKARHAEEAGAVSVVIFNQERPDDYAVNMGAGDTTIATPIGVPVVQMPRFLARPILDALDAGEPICAWLHAYPYDDSVPPPAGCFGEPTEEPGTAGALRLTVAPNPSAGTAALSLTLPEWQVVRVEVQDALGRRVALLHDGPLGAGTHTLAFDGQGSPPGVYLVRVSGEGFAETRRVTLVR